MRRLSAEEATLWGRISGTIRPFGARKQPKLVDMPIVEIPPRLERAAQRHAGRTVVAANTKPQNTLDASWDKRLRMGAATPDFTIDLHGETLSSAHVRLNMNLAAAVRAEARIVLLITGRPAKDNPRLPPTSRGVIRASVGDWLAASPYAGQIAAIRNAHPRHGGAGAMYLILRRAR